MSGSNNLPAIVTSTLDPAGVVWNSRGLSAATPPEHGPTTFTTLKGSSSHGVTSTTQTFEEELVGFAEKYGIAYDPRYLFM